MSKRANTKTQKLIWKGWHLGRKFESRRGKSLFFQKPARQFSDEHLMRAAVLIRFARLTEEEMQQQIDVVASPPPTAAELAEAKRWAAAFEHSERTITYSAIAKMLRERDQ